MANLISFSLSKLNVSIVNEENVVKPPNKPTKTKNLILGLIINFSKKENKNPIKKQPVIFTIKVPSGKRVLKSRIVKVESKYLERDPIAPPIAI